MKKRWSNLLFALPLVWTSVSTTHAIELKAVSTGALRPILSEIGPQFEQATGHKLVISYVAGPTVVKKQIDSGESFDIALSASGVIGALEKEGKIASRAEIARAGIGVAVRSGAPKPDVATVDSLKNALLKAKSVAYATEGRSGAHFLQLLTRFGIADEMKGKLKALTAPTSIAAVASGEAEMAVLPIPGILAGKGVDLAGAIPKESQIYLQFAAGAVATSKYPQEAAALVKYLTAAQATAIYRSKGLEPAAP